MTTAQAIRYHQDQLDSSVMDTSINPTPRSIAYLRALWLKEGHR